MFHLLLAFIGPRALSDGLLELGQLFADLGEHSLAVGPVESDRACLLRDSLRADQRGQTGGDAADGAARSFALRLALVGLDPLPVLHHLAGAGNADVAEDVRVPPGQFFRDGVAHRREVELPLLARDAGLEDDLEEQVAQLLAVVGGVA